MMPNQYLPRRTAESSSPSTPSALPTIAPHRLSLGGLHTGGGWGPVTDLPTALGRPLTRLGKAVRVRGAGWNLSRGAGKSAR